MTKRIIHGRRIIRVVAAAGTVALVIVTANLMLGSQVLYKWEVPVAARVVDASSGDTVPEVRVRFGIGDTSSLFPVRDLKQSDESVGFTMTMQQCRGEGPFMPWLRKEALPDPAMYVFVFEADGYQSTEVAGTYGNLRPRPGGVGRSRFEYSLPTVTLRKSGASVTSNQAAGADRP